MIDPESDARRRRIRTQVQAFIAACAVLLVAVPVALETLEESVSPQVYAVLVSGAAAITAAAGLVTRIMNLPIVTEFIDRYIPWLSTETQNQ